MKLNPWIYILIGGALETLWATTLKLSNGFTEPLWIVATLVFLLVSMLFLNRGLHHGLPVGSAYTVWVGIGAVGSIAVGVLYFGDSLTILKALFLALIIGGVVGLQHKPVNEEEIESDQKERVE